MYYCKHRAYWLLAVVILCISQSAFAGYKLSMLPRYSPEEINNRIVPLADFLSRVLGEVVEPVVTTDFTEYERRLRSGAIHIGYENPLIYVRVAEAQEVLAMAVKGADGDKFRGLIITRSDSNIVSVEDLRGKTVSIVSFTSAGGYLSQKVSLGLYGIDSRQDMNLVEALDNKQENVVLSVYYGDADAGFIRESALNLVDNYVPPSQIRVIQRTAWLPNWALSVSRKMPADAKQKIQAALTSLKAKDPVLKALKIDAFRPAEDENYNVMREAAGIPINR